MDSTAKQTIMWAFTIRGIVSLFFGLAAVFWPGITLVTLVYLFSAFILASGLISLVSALGNLYEDSRSLVARLLLALVAVVEIGVGVYLIRHIGVSLATFILIIGFVLLARGVIDILGGLFDETASSSSKTASVLIGIVTALTGIVILLNPASGGLAFVWVLGLYALITGPILIALGIAANHELENAKLSKKVRSKKA